MPVKPFLLGKAGLGGTLSSVDGNNIKEEAVDDVLDFDVNRSCSLGNTRSLKWTWESLFNRSSFKIVLKG